MPGSQLDYYEFMGFSSAELKRRYAFYAERFQPGTRVLDVGCGRGEFLEVLAARGVNGVGVDLDAMMVEAARHKGLTATQGNAIDYLNTHGEDFDGVFASHLVEHLPTDQMEKLVEGSARALRPGGLAIFVTPNPANLDMHLGEFWIDLQHVRFYSPLIMRYVLHRSGLSDVQIGYSDLFRLGPELSYEHIPPFHEQAAQARWGPYAPLRDGLQAPSTSRRIAQLEQRVHDLMSWMQSLYPAAEYYVSGRR
ncbi:MAG: methyltransferase domain-containing protein [Candidatus Dormibacter sp.]